MAPPAEPPPPAEDRHAPEGFLRPLDLLRHEHDRQERVCAELESFAGAPGPESEPRHLPWLLAYLNEELPRHTRDEEEDLFPMLRARCLPQDGIAEVLAQLSREHALDGDLAGFIRADLEAVVGGHTRSPPLRLSINARAFAETQRRHIGWENRLVLPLARKRLTGPDLERLGRAMAARRGVPYPG
jgi:hemerythrin-like domain-containing protein